MGTQSKWAFPPQKPEKTTCIVNSSVHNAGNMNQQHNADDGSVENKSQTKYKVTIGNENLEFNEFEMVDGTPTGAQIAELYGAKPLSEFAVLQHLKSGELESLRPTETADLTAVGIERFFVIQGSELFRFQVEELSMEWPVPIVSVRTVKFLAGLDSRWSLSLERNGSSRVLGETEDINLAEAGVERLRLVKIPATVTVFYGGAPFVLEVREYTTEELLEKFHVPAGYALDRIGPNNEFIELKPHQKIVPVDKQVFESHPPVGQSS